MAHPRRHVRRRRGPRRNNRRRFEPLEPRCLLAAQPIISEFQAANDNTLVDGDGNAPDWIEIFNAGDQAVDLDGWHLTDRAGNLDKWTFPPVTLAAGEYLVVFASGQPTGDYVDAGGNLHTNFNLSAGGEYLALVEPDGTTVASEFAPAFPEQFVDVSYGVTMDTVGSVLVGPAAPVEVLIPTDDSLGTAWTLPSFVPDASAPWITESPPGTPATSGVGFETATTDPNLVAHWRLDEAAGTAGADSVFDSAGGAFPGTPNGGVTFGVDGASGLTNTAAAFSAGGVDVPYDPALNSESFTVTLWAKPNSTGSHASPITNRYDRWGTTGKTYGYVLYNVNGDWGFWTGNEIGATPWYGTVAAGTVQVNQWQHLAISYDAATNTKTLYIDGAVAATDTVAGEPIYSPNTVRDLHVGSGGDLGTQYRFDGDLDDVAVFDRALDEAAIQAIMNDGTPAGGFSAIGDEVNTDVSADMLGVNSTAFVRMPFTVADPNAFDTLLLRMKYDDGFIAYLNGQPVASRNAPALPTFDALATGTRADADAVEFDSFFIANPAQYLVAGENVLAIHGFNVLADDADFLIAAELETVTTTLNLGDVGFFDSPSPGESNPQATSEVPPLIGGVSHTPNVPTAAEPTVVTTTITPTSNPVAGVTLYWRVMFGTEASVVMVDDGSGSDAIAGDGVYSGVIPAGVAAAGEMLRYYITALDTAGNRMRAPRVNDTTGTDRDPEYFGTVVADPAVSSQLPILQWFAPDPTAGHTRSGTRASVFYDGEFYDNIFVRQRGQATNASKSQKFNFNDDHPFYVNERLGRVEEFNMNGRGADSSYLRQTLSHETFDGVGVPSSESFLTRMEVNGSFDRVGIFLEQIDGEFLKRNGLDPQGSLYKFVQRTNLDPVFNDVATGVEKKIPKDDTDFSDIQAVIDGLHLPTREERHNWVFDNFNVPEILNYLAVRAVIQDADDIRKNFYFYRDTYGTGEWSILPWDKDFTFGYRGDGGPNLDHPFFGEQEHLKLNANQWNVMLDVLFDLPATQEMYLRRLRTVMDQLLKDTRTWTGALPFEDRLDAMFAQAAADLARHGVSQGTVDSVKNFFEPQRTDLYVTQSIDNLSAEEPTVLLPEFAPATYLVPGDDSLGTSWTATTFDDGSWTPGETGLGYANGSPDAYDSLIRTRVKPQDVVTGATSILTRIAFDAADPTSVETLTLRMKYDDGFVAYINGTEVARRNFTGTPSWNATAANHSDSLATVFENIDVSPYISLLGDTGNVLAIHSINTDTGSSDQLILPELLDGIVGSGGDVAGIPHEQSGNPTIEFGVPDTDGVEEPGEIVFNPAGGNQDQEYISLANPNDTSVDVSGWRLTGGVEHTFAPGTVITAGGMLYVVPDAAAFRARTAGPSGGQGLFVQGGYSGHLSNLGETIRLVAEDGQQIASVTTPYAPSPLQQFLRVSEVMFNPPEPSTAEAGAGFLDANQFEFLELANTSPSVTLNLNGVRFTDGVVFDFTGSAVTSLGPGERVLVVRDSAAMNARYPGISALIAGQYTGGLKETGETIKLEDAGNSTIVQFTYKDGPKWPQAADGGGSSLVPIVLDADLDAWESWHASAEFGGSPGAAAAAAVVARHVYYAGSSYAAAGIDENGGAISAQQAAIATDKTALLPGQSATPDNVTNYSGGINGIIVDLAHAPDATSLAAADVLLAVGNGDDPAAWLDAARPTLDILAGGGRGGSDRLLLAWADDAPKNTWLEVTIPGGTGQQQTTGLPADDVFYFGNAIGETTAFGSSSEGGAGLGLPARPLLVNAADVIAIRDNPRGSLNPASILDPRDVNRDQRVDAVDLILARDNAAGPLSALRMIVASP